MPANFDIKLYQGDTYNFTMYLDGDYATGGGVTWTFAVSSSLTATPSFVLTTTPTANGALTVTYNVPTNRTTVLVSMYPAMTSALTSGTVYSYDLARQNGATDKFTFICGSLTLTEEIGVG